MFFWFLIIPLSLKAQNINQFGLLPVVSHTFVTPKLDFNFLAVSKISTIDQTVAGILYPAGPLEIYFQVQGLLKLRENVTLSYSYGFQRNNPLQENYTSEHRQGQQLIWVISFKEIHLYQRFRFEERFIQRIDHSDYLFGTRARYQLGFSRNIGTSPYFINLSNEIFAVPTGPRNAFLSEYIAYIGIGWKSKVGNIEVGLVYDTNVRNTGQDLRNLTLLQVMWSSSSTRMKKQKNNPMLHMRHF